MQEEDEMQNSDGEEICPECRSSVVGASAIRRDDRNNTYHAFCYDNRTPFPRDWACVYCARALGARRLCTSIPAGIVHTTCLEIRQRREQEEREREIRAAQETEARRAAQEEEAPRAAHEDLTRALARVCGLLCAMLRAAPGTVDDGELTAVEQELKRLEKEHGIDVFSAAGGTPP